MTASITIEPMLNSEDSEAFVEMLLDMYHRWPGTLEHEVGVHRLIRCSPFDEHHRRTTCFARVSVEGVAPQQTTYVRTYILDPYRLARNEYDHRETEAVEAVLNGHLELLVD